MRARIALMLTDTNVEMREVFLSQKPEALLTISPKATVPVLIVHENNNLKNTIIDESIEIMFWAFKHNDVLGIFKREDYSLQLDLVEMNDQKFKLNLDLYKYHVRFPEYSKQHYKEQCGTFLQLLESRLTQSSCLFGEDLSFADYAIFPFIRQFANVDIQWFNQSEFTEVKRWLSMILGLELFDVIMQKRDQWLPSK